MLTALCFVRQIEYRRLTFSVHKLRYSFVFGTCVRVTLRFSLAKLESLCSIFYLQMIILKCASSGFSCTLYLRELRRMVLKLSKIINVKRRVHTLSHVHIIVESVIYMTDSTVMWTPMSQNVGNNQMKNE